MVDENKGVASAALIEMLRSRVGSSFDDEATFSGAEVEQIIAGLSTVPFAGADPVGYLKPRDEWAIAPHFIYADEREEDWAKQVFTVPVFAHPSPSASEAQVRVNALERALDFMAWLSQEPILDSEGGEMTVAGISTHAELELNSIRKSLSTPEQGETVPSPETHMRLDVDALAASIVTAACELDEPADPTDDDTISITMKDLEAVVHRHVTAALESRHEA